MLESQKYLDVLCKALQHTPEVRVLRPASEREDDAEDDRRTVLDYCRHLFPYSLSPNTNTKYMTIIDPCDVHSSPNTLQAILEEHRNQKLHRVFQNQQ